MNNTNILLRNNYIAIPEKPTTVETDIRVIATILMNLEYYSYCLSPAAYRELSLLSGESINSWWKEIETELKSITGDDRNIGDFVVYKNFPKEVLDKSAAEYWIPQLLMYWGFPNHLFTEPEKPRKGMDPSERKSTTLMLANDSTLQNIFNSLLGLKTKWKNTELADAVHLSNLFTVDFGKIAFKENLVNLAKHYIENGILVKVKTATDVLRLAAGLSDGDPSLRTKVKFKSFNRKTRRFLMNILNDCHNLEEDCARRKNVWKKFFHNIHPGEFKDSHSRVVKIADNLYNDRLVTFNSRVEKLLKDKDPAVLEVLSTRPGEFMRRLVHTLEIYGTKASNTFIKILPRLSVNQLVTIRRFLEHSNTRETRVFPPKGNWYKLQISEPRPVEQKYVYKISKAIGKELTIRVPQVSELDMGVELIKLPNGNDEGLHARGTVFPIPNEVKFIRTASYWEKKTGHWNNWFDNGWNFFDENWGAKGACCWSTANHSNPKGSVFSGDPTNSKEMKGRGAQLIDLYPDQLVKSGIRYAVWNVLCYSGIEFADADVFAALQWGKDPQTGKLFEPSRCQLSFKLTGKYKTKYVCVIDLKTRELIYIDANLKSNVMSAESNGDILSKQMPAFMEHINSLPTVFDLFKESVSPRRGVGKVLYSNKGKDVGDQPSFIFSNDGKVDYKPMDLNKILNK